MTASAAASETAEALQDWVREHRAAMAGHLVDLVAHETPTTAPETFDRFFDLLAPDLEDLGFEVTRLEADGYGDHLLAVPGGHEPGDPVQLLVGHADTVWPLGTADGNPARLEDGAVRGPGSLDMKGSLTQLVFALRALDDLDLEPAVDPVILVNTDEEVGSPDSTVHVKRWAREAERVYVLEPSGGGVEDVKTARKAGGEYRLVVHGEAAHSGVDPDGGANAILELARLVQEVHDLPRDGASVNAGVVEGGTRHNVVPDLAAVKVDVRAPTQEAAEALAAGFDALEAQRPGTELDVLGGFRKPPMERTGAVGRLLERAAGAAEALGLDLVESSTGGTSDGNHASQHAPVLDGLGPTGEGCHQDHEHVDVDGLLARTALLARLLLLAPRDEASGAASGAAQG